MSVEPSPHPESEQDTTEIRLSAGPESSVRDPGAPSLHVRHDGTIDEASLDVAELFGLGALAGRHFVSLLATEDQESVARLLRLVLEMLTRLGCEFGQGYYFGKPIGARQARDLF